MRYFRPHNTTANPNWFNATDAQSLVPVLDRDSKLAERFVTLSGKFRLTQGSEAGQRLEDCWLPWQRDALKASFQARESLWVLGKGSGKSVSVAAFDLGFVMLSAIESINTRGLVAVVAPTIGGARIVFEHILEAVLADEELRTQFRTNAQARSLTHEASGITIQILTCDMKSAVGKRPVLLILDETHELAQINQASAVVHQLRLGGANWGRAFKVLSISTMPILPPQGEFKRQLAYAKAVRSGEIDDPDFLPLLFQFPMTERPDIDPLGPNQWWRGMPSLRTADQPGTMDASELERELKQAGDADDVESFALTLSQRLGIERNETDLAESILHSHWAKCEAVAPAGPYDFCAIGIDAGGSDDPMAVAVARRPTNNKRALDLWVTQFLTQTGYDRAHSTMQETYDEAIERDTLHIFETSEAAQAAVFDLVKQARPDVAGGDEHGITGFAQAFREETGKAFTSVPQNWQMAAALASLEGRLLDGAVRHSHCPLLMANVENLLIVESASGNRHLKKRDNRLSGQGYAKIDGIIAVVNSAHLMDEHGRWAFEVGRYIG
ncbi:hypothetical protein [Shimia sp.]|uniref:hypothetical protein n=1 Tax=Shimia sp. TaxID=1954381 RepID=UPI003298A841